MYFLIQARHSVDLEILKTLSRKKTVSWQSPLAIPLGPV